VFFEPTRTPWDLNFHLGDIPVRIHPSFWLFSAFLGWPYQQRFGFEYLLLWIACMFGSILVHELGHVAAGRFFGRPSHIILFAFGGLAVGDYQLRRRWQRVVIFLAGPLAGLALYGLLWLVARYGLAQIDPATLEDLPAVVRGLQMLLWMNLVWNVLNLIPVWPLDGGQISREAFSWLVPGRGIWLSLGISFLFSGSAAVYSILAYNNRELPYPTIDPIFAAIFFGLLALQSFQLLQQVEADRHRHDDGWERDPDLWK
jgi:stage IV sporulation protein FB